MSVIKTSDGTQTVHSSKYGVPYHSIHGALQETTHVFIDAGLNSIKDNIKPIKVLEMGFGTGLNALATLSQSRKNTLDIHYHTIESEPLDMETIQDLEYHQFIKEVEQEDLLLMHICPWEQQTSIGDNFNFTKHKCQIQDFKSDERFHVIYFDAFAPTAQPELWQPQVLQNMSDHLHNGGILVTYCAKGQFKRDLRSVGFQVEALPGPPRKREMTRAIKAS